MKLFFTTVITFLFIAPKLLATTYYVATTGNDNTGTGSLSQPFASLSRAIEEASPSDIIELRGGNYVSNEIRINKNNLTIRSYLGETAILTAVTNVEDISSCIWYNEPETVGGVLENLEIIGGYYYGIKFESDWDWDNNIPFANRHGASNITVRNCYIHHTGRDGVKLTPACSNITIENCQISHTGTGPGALLDYNAEGIDNVNAPNMTVTACYIHDIATTGIYVKGGGQNCLIQNNHIENTGEGGIYLGFYTDADWFNTDANPQYYENINGTVINNYILNVQYAGIGLFGAKDAKVWFNTIINAATADTYAALMLAPSDVWVSDSYTATPPNNNVSIQNNIFVQPANATMPMVRVRENAISGNVQWNNNLYYKNANNPIFIDDNITWEDLNFEQWQSQTNRDNNGLTVDPLLNAEGYLLPQSPCIDAGIPISGWNTDFEGQTRTALPDIGADELGNITAITTTMPNNYPPTHITPISNSPTTLLIANLPPIQTNAYIYNLNGQLIHQQTLPPQQFLWQLPDLVPSMYIIKISQTNTVQKIFVTAK